MSYQAVQWALDEAPMLRTKSGKPDTTARAVLVARAERADEQGRDSHASVVDVIWRTGYDERTVQRAEDRLAAAGLLVRDGTTRFGTTRWNLDMTKRREHAERDQIEASIGRRRSDNASRERSRRERQLTRVDSASTRVEFPSTRGDSASTHADSDSTRVDATPPEPPVNRPGTTQETTRESPSGGTLPPSPLRPDDPSGHRTSSENSLSEGGDQPPRPDTATHDRARDDEARHLRLVPPPGNGFGFCLPCHAAGKVTLAADPVNGAACAHHLRQEAS